MALDFSKTLVVGISATALFDLTNVDRVFKQTQETDPNSAIKKYRQFMSENENTRLKDGTGMPLVKALLALNNHQSDGDKSPVVEVVVISRNSPETGFRVLQEIRKRKLLITRSAFLAGEESTHYLKAFYVDLFLTANKEDAQKVIDSRTCAAAVVKSPPQNYNQPTDDEVRFVFDADAVLFSVDSELINQKEGLDEFHRIEDENQDIPLPEGPFAELLVKLSKVGQRFPGGIEHSPIKIAIMTARNSPAEMRVIKTLRKWDVYFDQAFFLGGLEKSRFLTVFKPHIFF